MAAVNYAEKWQSNILEILTGGTYISPFITTNVEWVGAKTFHFTQMSVSGYKNHNRNGGWNRGDYAQKDVPFTVAHDRDIEFLVDKADVDETNSTASIQNITSIFHATQQVPEMDATFFSKVSSEAVKAGLKSETSLSDITPTTVVAYLKRIFGNKKLKKYRAKGALIGYVAGEIMDALELADDFKRNINMDTIADGGQAIETRITSLDGITLIEVIEEERFYNKFNYDEGFVPTSDAKKINVLACTPLTTKTVPKISSIYAFEPGDHTEGDGWLYQNRSLWDTFVMPNGINGEVDSVFVDLQATSSYSLLDNTDEDDNYNESDTEDIDYSNFTLDELKSIAKEKNIEGYSKMNKKELIEKLG